MQGIPSAGSSLPVGALFTPHPAQLLGPWFKLRARTTRIPLRPYHRVADPYLFPWARGPPAPRLVGLHGSAAQV